MEKKLKIIKKIEENNILKESKIEIHSIRK